MNETGRFLNDFARSRSDIVEAKILALNEDGSYMCRMFASGALVRASPSNPNERYTANSLVLLGAPSASRTVVGTSHTILQRAPRQQRGISASTPDIVTQKKSLRPTVLGVDPDPLEIPAGGSGGEQIIRGYGFVEAATYEDGIEEDNPPDVTDTEVTMSIIAPLGTPLGLYDAEISGIIMKDAVRVVELEEAAHTVAAYIPGTSVFKISVDDGSLLRTSDALEFEAVRTFTIAPDTVIAFYEAGGAAILNRQLDILASITGVEGGLLRFPPVNEWTQIIYDGTDSLWYGSVNNLCKVNIETGAAVAVDAAGAIYEGVATDGTHVYACARDSKTVRKFVRATGAETDSLDLAPLDTTNGFAMTQPRNMMITNSGELTVICHDVADTSRVMSVRINTADMTAIDEPEGLDVGTAQTFFLVGQVGGPWTDDLRIAVATRASDLGTLPYDFEPAGDSVLFSPLFGVAPAYQFVYTDPPGDPIDPEQQCGRFLTSLTPAPLAGKLRSLGSDGASIEINTYEAPGEDVARIWVTVTAPTVPTEPRPCGFLAS